MSSLKQYILYLCLLNRIEKDILMDDNFHPLIIEPKYLHYLYLLDSFKIMLVLLGNESCHVMHLRTGVSLWFLHSNWALCRWVMYHLAPVLAEARAHNAVSRGQCSVAWQVWLQGGHWWIFLSHCPSLTLLLWALLSPVLLITAIQCTLSCNMAFSSIFER